MENKSGSHNNRASTEDIGAYSAPNYDDIPHVVRGESDNSDGEAETVPGISVPTISHPLSLADEDDYEEGNGSGVPLSTHSDQIHGNSVLNTHKHHGPGHVARNHASAASEIQGLYFQAKLKRVEFGHTTEGNTTSDERLGTCTLVMEVDFQPGIHGLRFSEAEVAVSFSDAPEFTPIAAIYKNAYVDGAYTGPTIRSLFPLPPHDSEGSTLLPQQLSTGVSQLRHDKPSRESPTQVSWTISEDKEKQEGIPRRCKFSIIVKHRREKRFCMTVGTKATLIGWRGVRRVKALGGYHDAHVFFGALQSDGEGCSDGVHEVSPAKQANEPEVLAEMKGLVGGTVSIRRPRVLHDSGAQPQTKMYISESGQTPSHAMYEWVTWLPPSST